MIVSTKEILKPQKVDKFKQRIVTEDINHEFFISKCYKEFIKQFTDIEQNKHYAIVSFGQWSLKHVVFHLLKMIGTSEIYSTTYGLGQHEPDYPSCFGFIALAVNIIGLQAAKSA